MSCAELKAAFEHNPWPAADSKTVHFFFLAASPDPSALNRFSTWLTDTESAQMVDNVLFLNAPDGIGRSKAAANVERDLGIRATARNLRTVAKLVELAHGIEW